MNAWCEALGIQVPSLEQVREHREAKTFALLLVALLERAPAYREGDHQGLDPHDDEGLGVDNPLVYTGIYPLPQESSMTGSGSEPGGGSPPRRARLFWNGRSQAVRLPKEFRFPGDAVEIRREGGAVILEPVKEATWPDGYWDWMAASSADLELGDVAEVGADLLELDFEEP